MNRVVSVSELNRYIKEWMAQDFILSNVLIRGEISNYKYHYSGHMYFTLKDENALLKCVMFKTQNMTLKFAPENGMKVIAKGYISVYERDGQFQLYAQELQPDGIGALHMAFEQLRKKLQGEGLFDPVHKKPLPMLPQAVGIITSSTGAVIRDIIHVVRRRFYNMRLLLLPVAVQGEQASKQIARAVKKFNELRNVDVIIIARGGGSLEELWAFNEEIVARSIFKSAIPVVSAVGHETDFTIADFVADLRAPTPSAAAELVVPQKTALRDKINVLNMRLVKALTGNVRLYRAKFERLMGSPAFKQPLDRINQERMRLDFLNKYMLKALLMNKEREKQRLYSTVGKLNALSPLTIMARGYSLTKLKPDGRLLRSVNDVNGGDEVEIYLSDGKVDCVVSSKHKNEGWEG